LRVELGCDGISGSFRSVVQAVYPDCLSMFRQSSAMMLIPVSSAWCEPCGRNLRHEAERASSRSRSMPRADTATATLLQIFYATDLGSLSKLPSACVLEIISWASICRLICCRNMALNCRRGELTARACTSSFMTFFHSNILSGSAGPPLRISADGSTHFPARLIPHSAFPTTSPAE